MKKWVALFIVTYFIFFGFIVEPNSLKVTKYTISNPDLAGARIAFLSDFHFKKNARHDFRRIQKIVELTEKQKPNLILLGGDYVSNKKFDDNDFSKVSLLASKLSLIGVPVYGVMGDSDWNSDGNRIYEALQGYGVSVLFNSSKMTRLNKKYVNVVGLEDLKTRQPNIDRALSKTRRLKIVITHNPDVYYDIIDDVVLILAGHTHGGQFVIPFTPRLFVDSKFGSKFASGLIDDSNNKMIISRGIGTTGIPIRFNCRPEIVIVDFVE